MWAGRWEGRTLPSLPSFLASSVPQNNITQLAGFSLKNGQYFLWIIRYYPQPREGLQTCQKQSSSLYIYIYFFFSCTQSDGSFSSEWGLLVGQLSRCCTAAAVPGKEQARRGRPGFSSPPVEQAGSSKQHTPDYWASDWIDTQEIIHAFFFFLALSLSPSVFGSS